MGKEECLAVLQPNSTTKESTTPGTAGARFTAADAAQALAYCRSKVGAMLLMTQIGGVDCRRQLERETLKRVMLMAIGEDWLKRGESLDRAMMDRLVALALDEAIEPQLCGVCQGRGHLSARGKRGVVETCRQCGGSGADSRRRSARSYASALGVDDRAWTRKWLPRYQRIAGWLAACESSATGELVRALR